MQFTETTKITSKGQATIPAKIRELLQLHPGDRVLFQIVDGAVALRKAEPLDIAYLQLAGAGFEEEWLSPEDEEAFGDL